MDTGCHRELQMRIERGQAPARGHFMLTEVESTKFSQLIIYLILHFA